MRSATRSKIKLEYSSSSPFKESPGSQDLHQMLEESQFIKKKLKQAKPAKVDDHVPFTPGQFQTVYDLILKMRRIKDAPVDVDGPEQLYDRTADINDQRFQILVALMISPQTKDETTGAIMRQFLKLPCTIEKVAATPVEEIKHIVYKANFNSTKARRILTAAERVKKDLKGEMPQTYEDVMLFEGVGEKIALLYMLVAMKHCLGIAVDVNVMRVANRIPLSREQSPGRMRRALEDLVPKKQWEEFNDHLVGFGQQICRPGGRERCDVCLLYQNNLCQYGHAKKSAPSSNSSKSKSKIIDEDV